MHALCAGLLFCSLPPPTPTMEDLFYAPVELALVPALSTNALVDDPPINFLSLSAAGGKAAHLYGLGVGLAASTVEVGLIGLQLSGLANLVRGAVWGVQASGGVNFMGQESHALQVGGILNLAGADLNGGQIGGVLNLSGATLNGLQVAGVLNRAGVLVRGGQIAVLNIVEDIVGGQGGVVNIAGDVTGGQLGVVNVADDVAGLQLGVVNVASSVRGAALGLVNIVGDGILAPEVWSDDTSLISVGLKTGSRWSHTMLSAGLQPLGERWIGQTGLTLGGRVSLGESWFVDVDAGCHSLWRDGQLFEGLDLLNKLRLTAGWRLLPHLAVVGGLSANVLVSTVGEEESLTYLPAAARYVILEAPRIALWPGAHLGIQF